MANYEGMFQDRYTRALSMFADAAAEGKDPREILTQMQTNPTYGQATGRGNLPSGSMTQEELEALSYKVAPEMRPTGSGATSDMEFRQYQKDLMGRGPDFGGDLKRLAIESGMLDKSEADRLTPEELQALSYQLAPKMRPQGAGSTSDLEFQQYMQDAVGGGINALISTPNELLLNLGRKLTGE